MGLDIRVPIGMLFAILGTVLVVFGKMGDQTIYTRSLGYNVNVLWGAVLVIFGFIMLYYGRRGDSSMKPAETTPEGRAVEAREHAAGLEVEDATLPDHLTPGASPRQPVRRPPE